MSLSSSAVSCGDYQEQGAGSCWLCAWRRGWGLLGSQTGTLGSREPIICGFWFPQKILGLTSVLWGVSNLGELLLLFMCSFRTGMLIRLKLENWCQVFFFKWTLFPFKKNSPGLSLQAMITQSIASILHSQALLAVLRSACILWVRYNA